MPRRLVLPELLAHAPAAVVRQRVAVLLEERVDAGDAAVPRVLQVLQRQPPVLAARLLLLQRVLGPYALRVDELGLPGLYVAIQVGDELILVVRHACMYARTYGWREGVWTGGRRVKV